MRASIYQILIRMVVLIGVFVMPLNLPFKTSASPKDILMLGRADDYQESLERTEVIGSSVTAPFSNKQSKSNRGNLIVNQSLQRPVECETAKAYFDNAIVEMLQLKETYLIIIARLGATEKRQLNKSRLIGIERYLEIRGVTKNEYVVAEGSKTDGLGRIELYVGGKLLYKIPLKKNAEDICSE